MSRLTEVFSENEAKYICLKECKEDCQNGHIPTCQCKQNIEAWKKLAHYEELEEQGRLIELPCSIGDVVYHIESGEVFTGIVFRIDYLPYAGTCMLGAYDMDNCFLGVFGESCFTTRQEAERKLAELKGE